MLGLGLGIPQIAMRGRGKSLEQQIRALFTGQQGAWYDPSDMSTLFQDAAGQAPVTALGHPVGLWLDQSRGLALGPELNVAVTPFTVYRDGSTNIGSPTLMNVTAGKTYEIRFTISENTSTSQFGFRVINSTNYLVKTATFVGPVSGEFSCRLTALVSGGLILAADNAFVNATVSDMSIREIPGNHATQSTAASRPIYRENPQRIDYDAVDDKLTTTFPDLGTDATIVRSLPGSGASILTGQTIGAGAWDDSTDHCGLLIIDRALTVDETALVTQWANERAGV